MFRKCISSVLIIQFLYPKVTPFVSKISLPLQRGAKSLSCEGEGDRIAVEGFFFVSASSQQLVNCDLQFTSVHDNHPSATGFIEPMGYGEDRPVSGGGLQGMENLAFRQGIEVGRDFIE